MDKTRATQPHGPRGREGRGRPGSPAPSAACGSPAPGCLSWWSRPQLNLRCSLRQQAKVTVGHFLTGWGRRWRSTWPPVTRASCRPRPPGEDASMVPGVQRADAQSGAEGGVCLRHPTTHLTQGPALCRSRDPGLCPGRATSLPPWGLGGKGVAARADPGVQGSLGSRLGPAGLSLKLPLDP